MQDPKFSDRLSAFKRGVCKSEARGSRADATDLVRKKKRDQKLSIKRKLLVAPVDVGYPTKSEYLSAKDQLLADSTNASALNICYSWSRMTEHAFEQQLKIPTLDVSSILDVEMDQIAVDLAPIVLDLARDNSKKALDLICNIYASSIVPIEILDMVHVGTILHVLAKHRMNMDTLTTVVHICTNIAADTQFDFGFEKIAMNGSEYPSMYECMMAILHIPDLTREVYQQAAWTIHNLLSYISLPDSRLETYFSQVLDIADARLKSPNIIKMFCFSIRTHLNWLNSHLVLRVFNLFVMGCTMPAATASTLEWLHLLGDTLTMYLSRPAVPKDVLAGLIANADQVATAIQTAGMFPTTIHDFVKLARVIVSDKTLHLAFYKKLSSYAISVISTSVRFKTREDAAWVVISPFDSIRGDMAHFTKSRYMLPVVSLIQEQCNPDPTLCKAVVRMLFELSRADGGIEQICDARDDIQKMSENAWLPDDLQRSLFDLLDFIDE